MPISPALTRRWNAAPAVLLASAAIAQLAAYWPGVMIYDAIRQYGQALSGRFDDWHPPTFEYLWRRLIPLHDGPASMLLLQWLLYWGGFALLGGALFRQGRVRAGYAVAACALLPIPFALVGALLKDSMMAGALLAAAGLLAWRPAGWTAGPAWLLLMFAATLRFNAFLAVVPLGVMLLPEAARRSRGRVAAVSIALAIPLLLVMPAVNRMLDVERSGVALSLVIYDLGGITEQSGVNVFPPVGVADPVAVNHRCYSPVKWDRYAWWTDAPCPIGFDNIRAWFAAGHRSANALWLRAIAAHPIAYAVHRLRHFNVNSRFLVNSDIERPVFAQSDPNPWGLQVPQSGLRLAIDRLALASARTPLGWPICWMALAGGTLLLRPRGLAAALAWSALLYGLGYLPLSVASEMRYHFWTMIAAALAAVLAFGEAHSGRQRLIAALPVAAVAAIAGGYRLVGG